MTCPGWLPALLRAALPPQRPVLEPPECPPLLRSRRPLRRLERDQADTDARSTGGLAQQSLDRPAVRVAEDLSVGAETCKPKLSRASKARRGIDSIVRTR